MSKPASKSAEAFRTISEVAEVLDTPAHVLRFWESRFPQVKPVKRAGGRRYYRPADVALLGGIRKLLHDDGLTIRGVQKMLREQGIRHVAAFAGLDEADHAPAPEGASAARPLRRWPEAPSPDIDPAGDHLLPDPDDAAVHFDEGPALSPLRPDRAPQVTARDDLQRERLARRTPADAPAPETHFDRPMERGDWLPAAALLRAMTLNRAAQRQDELRAIYDRLSAVYDRRRGAGN